MTLLDRFHPAVSGWFRKRFDAPTDAQEGAWPEILAKRDLLLAAPTGSGKTLAAFLCAINDLLVEPGGAGVRVLYISPLKALSSDIERNLIEPLAGIREEGKRLGLELPAIRTGLRTGDTTSKERQQILARPPDILITTPESLYLLVTAEKSRAILETVTTVIVDEIHALLRDKRGSHLALTLARLDHLAKSRPGRIGLSATQRPLDRSGRFLVGRGQSLDSKELPDCAIIDIGHQRELDLRLELPETELEAVCSHDQWGDIYNRLADLISQHRTTLIFVNTRRLAERTAHQLSERIGIDAVGSHHGSLSKERRLQLEQRLKHGDLKAMVATASLELGIDIGSIDLVCQLESPRSVSTFLQRVGRSGHALGLRPKGRLFPTTRDELVECVALLQMVRNGRLDTLHPPVAPLDILAQQIVAECGNGEWDEDQLFDLVRGAAPFADLDRDAFDEIIELLSEGIPSGVGRVGHYLHRDRINRKVHGRRHARRSAIENGGAIPENADYQVRAEPEGTFVGTLNEDFAIESMAGDIFLLGTNSWRIRRVERGVVRVEDAKGAPPTIPFWLGEAPSRTLELSVEVSRLRSEIANRIVAAAEAGPDKGDVRESVYDAVARDLQIDQEPARQLVSYVSAVVASLGLIPSQTDVVFERFFDESGGMQLVVHAPFGGRVNRAWGLGLRKRFCKTFDFELQAAANDDAVLLSLGPQNSFPLEDVFKFLNSKTIEETLSRAVLTSPMFNTRWRWNATRFLAVSRQRHGKRVAPPIQRMRSDDLLAAVFPDQVACQENQTGPVEAPDHPLVNQTMHDCLHEAMDTPSMKSVLEGIESGRIRLHARDTTEPSVLSHEILNSKPYTFLDDAPLEERRARAISLRRSLPADASDLGALDEDAIARVRTEAEPDPRNAEEVHECLLSCTMIESVPEWRGWIEELVDRRRAGSYRSFDGREFWIATENKTRVEAILDSGDGIEWVEEPESIEQIQLGSREDALRDAVSGHLEQTGPMNLEELGIRLGLPATSIRIAVAALESEGSVLRGRFRPRAVGEEVCSRRLLSRIHRYTLDRLRSEIEPQPVRDYLLFLLDWQNVTPRTRLQGKRGLRETIAKLQGYEAPAIAWEQQIFPARIDDYRSEWLDELCLSGEVTWARLSIRAPQSPDVGRAPANATTPVSMALRSDLSWLLEGVRGDREPVDPPHGAPCDVLEPLRKLGALFHEDLVRESRRLPEEVERGLWELVARGLVSADSFGTLRTMMQKPLRRQQRMQARRGRPRWSSPIGRWSLVPSIHGAPIEELAENWARQLLERYGVVLREVVQKESVSVPWRELIRAFRRLESRGEIRGGRFVLGFYGEQYALPSALARLRRVRREEPDARPITLGAVDPLNLSGTLLPGPRVPSIHTHQVVYREGVIDLPSSAAPESAHSPEDAPPKA